MYNSMDSIELPAQVLRKYYSVPDNYTIGETFTDWNDALVHARERYETVRRSVAASMGEFDHCKGAEGTPYLHSDRCAQTSIVIHVRWVVKDGNGTEHDLVVEKHHNVKALRLRSGPVV